MGLAYRVCGVTSSGPPDCLTPRYVEPLGDADDRFLYVLPEGVDSASSVCGRRHPTSTRCEALKFLEARNLSCSPTAQKCNDTGKVISQETRGAPRRGRLHPNQAVREALYHGADAIEAPLR